MNKIISFFMAVIFSVMGLFGIPYDAPDLEVKERASVSLSEEQLALARNEIYARHGRKFKTAVYNNYFSGCGWYSVNPNYNYSDDNSNLNDIEVKNVNFILKAEKR